MNTRTLITDIEDMRAYISDVYKGERWKRKVARMRDSQVMAIYFSFMDRITKTKRPKTVVVGELQPWQKANEDIYQGEQIGFDDYLESKSLEDYLR